MNASVNIDAIAFYTIWSDFETVKNSGISSGRNKSNGMKTNGEVIKHLRHLVKLSKEGYILPASELCMSNAGCAMAAFRWFAISVEDRMPGKARCLL